MATPDLNCSLQNRDQQQSVRSYLHFSSTREVTLYFQEVTEPRDSLYKLHVGLNLRLVMKMFNSAYLKNKKKPKYTEIYMLG